MKKGKYREKPKFENIKLNSNNTYYQLIDKDSLYPQNLGILKDPQFKTLIQKITQDLNLLLLMNDQQFWKQLEQNTSIKMCLQSCLSVFPRRNYSGYQSGGSAKRETIYEKDIIFTYYSLLMKVVLLIYYRISSTNTTTNKTLIYNQWLLDIPKLLQLVSIYGESNPQIVRQLILNVYNSISNYDGDTISFFELIEDHKLLVPPGQRQIEVDFSPKALKSKYFGNRQRYMVQEAVQEMFRVKDLLLNLTYFLQYFPEKYAYQLAVDYRIQERLLKSLAIFLQQAAEDWKMGDYQKYFEWHLQDIRQSIARYFILSFKLLRNILQNKKQPHLRQIAQNTYETLCLIFSQKQGEKYNVYFRRMINNLIEESKEIVFFLPSECIQGANRRTYNSVEKCIKYQQFYRKQKRLEGYNIQTDEVYLNFKKTLTKWKDINTQLDTTYVKQFEKDRELKRRNRQGQPGDYRMIMKLKYQKLSAQYYDDWEEIDQFRRLDLLQGPVVIDKEINLTFIGLEKRKKIQYKEKNSIRDSQLSIWSDLSQNLSLISEANNLNFDFGNQSIQNNEVNMSHFKNQFSIKKNKKQMDTSIAYQAKENKNIKQKEINLSIFDTTESKQNEQNLSLEMVSKEQLASHSQTSLQIRTNQNFIEKEDDQKQLQSILLDINDQINESKYQQKSKNKDYDAQFLKFEWDNEKQLSFDVQW